MAGLHPAGYTDKIVYSSSLDDVSTARTTIERTFEPEGVRQLKETFASDLSIGGAGVAAEAFRHGLVDECVLLLCPVLVDGGKPARPHSVRLNLDTAGPATIRQRRDLRSPRGPESRLTLILAEQCGFSRVGFLARGQHPN